YEQSAGLEYLPFVQQNQTCTPDICSRRPFPAALEKDLQSSQYDHLFSAMQMGFSAPYHFHLAYTKFSNHLISSIAISTGNLSFEFFQKGRKGPNAYNIPVRH